jgi:hypothetical protein
VVANTALGQDTISILLGSCAAANIAAANRIVGVIVELRSDALRRYAQSDGDGGFLFDGLLEGNYQVSAFASGYPLNAQLLAGPKPAAYQSKGLLPSELSTAQEGWQLGEL